MSHVTSLGWCLVIFDIEQLEQFQRLRLDFHTYDLIHRCVFICPMKVKELVTQ